MRIEHCDFDSVCVRYCFYPDRTTHFPFDWLVDSVIKCPICWCVSGGGRPDSSAGPGSAWKPVPARQPQCPAHPHRGRPELPPGETLISALHSCFFSLILIYFRKEGCPPKRNMTQNKEACPLKSTGANLIYYKLHRNNVLVACTFCRNKQVNPFLPPSTPMPSAWCQDGDGCQGHSTYHWRPGLCHATQPVCQEPGYCPCRAPHGRTEGTKHPPNALNKNLLFDLVSAFARGISSLASSI